MSSCSLLSFESLFSFGYFHFDVLLRRESFFFKKKDLCLEDEDSFIDVDLQVEVEQSDGLPAGNLGRISLQTKQNWKNLEDWQTNLFVNLFPFIAVCYFRLTKQKESLTRNES